MIERIEPAELGKNHWGATYQYLNIKVEHDKVFMPTSWQEGVSIDELVGKVQNGVLTTKGMVDGVQQAHSGLSGVDPSRMWINGRAMGYDSPGTGTPSFDDSIEVMARYLTDPSRVGSVVFLQFMEDSNIHGSSNPDRPARFVKIEQVLRRASEILRDEYHIPLVKQRLVSDYFAGIYGWDSKVFIGTDYANAYRLMSNQTEARKTQKRSDGTYEMNNYHANRGWEYRKKLAQGYVDGIGAQWGGGELYDKMFSMEVQYLQDTDVTVWTYSTGTFEGISLDRYDSSNPDGPTDGGPDRTGSWIARPIVTPGGDLYQQIGTEGSYDLLRNQTYACLSGGDGVINWDVNFRFGNNQNCWYNNGSAEQSIYVNEWKKDGDDYGQRQQYYWPNPAAGQPRPNCAAGTTVGISPKTSDNGMWAAHYLYGQIWKRRNQSFAYVPFTFNEDGGPTQAGYYNGNNPVTGSLGNAEVSRFGVSNYGQSNIVHSKEAGLLPICRKGIGTDGIYYEVLNIRAGFYGETRFNTPDGPIIHRGDGWGIYTP